jgi:hypothetical protein
MNVQDSIIHSQDDHFLKLKPDHEDLISKAVEQIKNEIGRLSQDIRIVKING